MLDRSLSFSKCKHTRSIIIDDGYSSARVLSVQALLRLTVEQLHEEILIGLPFLVVFDCNFNLCVAVATLGELYNLLYLVVI